MRLKEIKLAGFKSFVDPTTVVLPGNRNAVVGPNGCGKSNIIDAVRWVMGESSARQLRGEALTDVIFNGSNSRMPTALASIELKFDNRDGRVGGEFGKYSEIAIRREVSRVAQSTYYLNGTKCRRRDIGDVFLGTGFGPRSYSIIEQGMISQLVEAKPEDLRAYLEEAAGISRYKERRRETQNRIRHTVENLARLSDIREELDRQLAHLKRQANAAERYRALKEDERRRTAELYAIRLAAVGAELSAQETKAQTLSVALEAAASERQAVDTALDRSRVVQAQGSDEMNAAQGRYHQLGADAGKLEQAVEFDRQRIDQLKDDLATVAEQRREAERQFDADAARIAAMREDLAVRKPVLDQSEADEVGAARALEQLEGQVQAAERSWEAYAGRRADNERELEVCQERIQYAEQVLHRLRERATKLGQEPAAVEDDGIAELAQRVAQAAERVAALDAELSMNTAAVKEASVALAQCERAVEDADRDLERQRREIAALAAAQEVALGREASSSTAVDDWLASQDLRQAPRLGEALTVEPGWERALETVLGRAVQALLVADEARLAEYAQGVEQLPTGRLTLSGRGRSQAAVNGPVNGPLPAFADYVQGPCGSLLAGVFAAPSVAVALTRRADLGPGQSIVTRTGVWLGVDWLRMDKGSNADDSVIRRARDLTREQSAADKAEAGLANKREAREAARASIAALTERRDRLQSDRTAAAAHLARVGTAHDVRRVRLDEATARRRRNLAERAEIETQVNAETAVIHAGRERLAELIERRAALATEGADLDAARARGAERTRAARVQTREARDAHQRMRLAYQSLGATLDATEAGRERLLGRRRELESRADELLAVLADVEAGLPLKRQALENKLTERVGVENQLVDLRRRQERIQTEIRDLTGKRAGAEQHVDTVRGDLETARVERERLSANCDNLLVQLAGTGMELATVREGLPDDASEDAWQELLDGLQRRIARLGPINLAAIDEYSTQAERKEYLDRQHADLEAALTTLRGAIRRIDTDTRKRFKDTFDQVNEYLKILFPKVFGGGHAYLELTGDDWLDTGVALMARPPGKRNASIHLLSGGEKAMTAVALIFSIFKLNPSPVCLLDEVDAPLDDANVARFGDLIREMSQDVQFVVITHNKQTIEMADHLLGVTMQEAGVSRLVSVDVESAASMVAAG